MSMGTTQVVIYYNTGLSPGISMDSPDTFVRAGFATYVCNAIVTYQIRGLLQVQVELSVDKLSGADYCVMRNASEGDIYYWITKYEMLNPQVARLYLQCDYITSVGVDNITVTSGWCIRRHKHKENGLFTNTINEPFTPMEPFKIEYGGKVQPTDTTGSFINILVSTVDLINLSSAESGLGKEYNAGDASRYIVVPQVPVMTRFTTFAINNIGNVYNLPCAGCFSPTVEKVSNGVREVRSLGIDSCLVDSYTIPSEYVYQSSVSSDGFYSDITGVNVTVDSNIETTWDIPGVNDPEPKVYSGQFQKIHIISIASGERQEFNVEDILDNVDKIKWQIMANPLPDGNPMCRPLWYHNVGQSYAWLGNINGVQWQKNPIYFGSGVSGYGMNSAGFVGNLLNDSVNKIMSTATSFIGQKPTSDISKAAFSTRASDASNIAGASSYMLDKYGEWWDYERSNFNVAPEVKFSPLSGIQNFIGNYFYELRYRLSDRDCQRFNEFLMLNGEAVSERFDKSFFHTRQYVNFIQTENAEIKLTGWNTEVKTGIENLLNSGVRIWHTIPSKLTNNPDSGGS